MAFSQKLFFSVRNARNLSEHPEFARKLVQFVFEGASDCCQLKKLSYYIEILYYISKNSEFKFEKLENVIDSQCTKEYQILQI